MMTFRVPLSLSEPVAMTAAEIDAFARRTGWVDDLGVISPETSSVQIEPLPWWPGRQLVIAQDPTWQGVMAAWILDDRLHRLDGGSPVIHQMNATAKPTLTPEQVLAYLGFFCTFVHGPDGPFAIVNSAEDSILPSKIDKNRIAEFVQPAKLLKSDQKGHHVEANVFYDASLFLTLFIVAPSGVCEMTNDDMLCKNVGEKILMPLAHAKRL